MQALVFDCETTSLIYSRLSNRQPEIIEICMMLVDLDTGEILGTFDTLVKPTTPINEKTKAHKKVGITNDMVKDAPSFAMIADDVKLIVEGAPLVIAHNCVFDTEMLEIEFGRLGKVIEWPRKLCSVEQTCHLEGYNLSLTALHEYLFQKKFKDAHRASSDVKALIDCCVELHKRGII